MVVQSKPVMAEPIDLTVSASLYLLMIGFADWDYVSVATFTDYNESIRQFKKECRNKSVKWVELRCCHAKDSRSGLMEFHSNERDDESD
jgi:hypothetical protein